MPARASASAPKRRTRMVTASARVGARSRAKLGVPSGLVLEPRKSPRLYSSSASSWASSGVAARAGTDREKARLKARNKETIFFFMIHPFFGSAPTRGRKQRDRSSEVFYHTSPEKARRGGGRSV